MRALVVLFLFATSLIAAPVPVHSSPPPAPVGYSYVLIDSDSHEIRQVGKFRLFTCRDRCKRHEKAIKKAASRVETSLGKFEKSVCIIAVKLIKPEKFLGMQWTTTNGGCCICVCDSQFETWVLTHEMVHVRLAERDNKMPLWLEEGFCDFIAGHKRSRPEKIIGYTRLDKLGDTDEARDYGYWLCRYWVARGKTAEDIAKLAGIDREDWPAPADVWKDANK